MKKLVPIASFEDKRNENILIRQQNLIYLPNVPDHEALVYV